MRARSPELAAHQALDTTSLVRCTRIERRDGRVLTLNSSDDDIVFGGERYIGRTGVTGAALAQQAGAAVDNSELGGFLDEESVTERDVVADLWDGAFVTIFELNYADVSMGPMNLSCGTLGDLSVGRTAFKCEFRSLTQALQQQVGEVFTRACTATLGDARCKVNLAPLTVTGALTLVTDRRNFADAARLEAPDYFGGGLLTMTSGACAGASMEIAGFNAGAFALVLPLPFNIDVGDTYTAVPGCRKRLIEDCKTKFSNVLNFRGFPYFPGDDKVLGLGGTEGTNL